VAASWNESHLYESMRPLVREILAARLRATTESISTARPTGHTPSSETVTFGASPPRREPPSGAGAAACPVMSWTNS